MVNSGFKRSLTEIVRIGLLDKIIEIHAVAIFNSDCSEEEFHKIKMDGMFYAVISEVLLWNKDKLLDKGDALKKDIERTFLKFLDINFETIKNEIKESALGG